MVRSDVAGTGAEEVDTSGSRAPLSLFCTLPCRGSADASLAAAGLWWSFYQMPKYILRKRLFPGRGAPRTD